MANFESRIRIGGTGTLTAYRGSFTGATGALEGTEPNDGAGDGEIAGEILDGEEIYGFNGVPTGFEAQHPWELDLALDLGTGWVDWRPTYLNAGTMEIRAQGGHNATYLFRMPEPGMVIRTGEDEDNDVIVNGPNTFGTGHSIGGDTDSFDFWPPFGLEVLSDHPAEWRIPDAGDPELSEWTPVTIYTPEMSV